MSVKITYRKRPNKRAIPLWETEQLYESMQDAVELLNVMSQVPPSASDDSSVHVDYSTLWNLCTAYISSYERLMRESLITSGNIHKIQPTLN